MARKKKELKAKEPIKLRFKELSNGNKSIYMDVYRNGKRTYEFLKLYITPETSQEDKIKNEATLSTANAIKAKRIVELQNSEHGFSNVSNRNKMLLCDYIDSLVTEKREAGNNSYALRLESLRHHISKYSPHAQFKDITADYIKDFVKHLQGQIDVKSDFTVNGYYRFLNVILNRAVKKGLLESNPNAMLEKEDKPNRPTSLKTYLTLDEVKALVQTPCVHPEIKSAFLFSCFCGLRISDVLALTWKDIEKTDNKYQLAIKQKKTKEPIYLPLSNESVKQLPERKGQNDKENVFKLPSGTIICQTLKGWALAAGIKNKKVTFHVSRHTFATLSLTLGADLYTVCKLLGHRNLASTQVYAKIVDESKRKAVDMFDGIID